MLCAGPVDKLWIGPGLTTLTIIESVDPLLDTDWVAHWRSLVAARTAQSGSRVGGFEGQWARRYAFSMEGQPDPFLGFLEPWLAPHKTLLDVGAGTGRHAYPLSRRLDWVTAVEPSESMRALIPPADNMTVVASTWEEAEPAPADLVICVHVLYSVADIVPFLRKLEASARERVFVVLRDEPRAHPWDALVGSRRVREPLLRDCYLVLRQMGVAPDLSVLRYPVFYRFESLEAAAEEFRARLGALWEERGGRTWLEENLREEGPGGGLRYEAGERTSGVLHWSPRS